MKATVVITTKNRRDELRVAIQSAKEQSAAPEVLVIDDGSTDGTAEKVRQEFPEVSLVSHAESRGLIVRRNEAARVAKGEVIFSIDDDAEFSSPDIVMQTLEAFSDPRIAAVAIPYIDVKKNPAVRQLAPDAENVWITDSFIGTAHAVRRDVFLAMNGYREHLVHQGEEGDLCLMMLDAGWLVRLGSCRPIYHYESPRRDFRRMDFYGRRNDVLFVWHNVPVSWLLFHLVATTKNGLLFGLKVGRPWRMLTGLLQGYLDILRYWHQRKPVSVEAYQLSRLLKKSGPFKMREMEAHLQLSTVAKPQSNMGQSAV
jgi:glycosyltransferase involved in cell wall biosynthesis